MATAIKNETKPEVKQPSKENKKAAYQDNTIIFSSWNSEKDKEHKAILNLTKWLKVTALFALFISITLLVFAFAKAANKVVVGSILAKDYSEIFAIPILTLINTALMAMLIKGSSKNIYTIGRRRFTLLMYLVNILFGLMTPIILTVMDISSKKHWFYLFLVVGIVEAVRVFAIYLILFIKSKSTRNLFPIEYRKMKRMLYGLITMAVPILLSWFVYEARVSQNDRMRTISLAILITVSVVALLLFELSFVWAYKLNNRSSFLIERDEQQQTTMMSYIITVLVAPFIGISIANLENNQTFNYWIIGAILISLIMLIAYGALAIIDYRRSAENKRSSLLNSTLLSAFLFINALLLIITHTLTSPEMSRWNYVFLIIFGIYTTLILLTNIIFNIETFKYLWKTKLFIIYSSFILIMINILAISSLINNEAFLILFNGEITTLLFVVQIIPFALMLIINIMLLLKITSNSNRIHKEKNDLNKNKTNKQKNIEQAAQVAAKENHEK